MKSELHILQAIDSEGNSVYIDDVQNGKRCNCTCKECGGKLIARNKGKVRIHHFSHENGKDSIKCSQTALHLLAKEIISEIKRIPIIRNGEIIFAKVPFVDHEKNLGDIKPDLYAEYDGKPIAIEIFVTHKVDKAKLNKIKTLKLTTFEINLSQLNFETKECVAKAIYDIKNIDLLYDEDIFTKREEEQKKNSWPDNFADSNLETDFNLADAPHHPPNPDDAIEPPEVTSEIPQQDDIESEYLPIDKMTLEAIESKKQFLSKRGKKLLLWGYGDAPLCPHPLASRQEPLNEEETCIKNYHIPLSLCKRCVHCFYPDEQYIYCGYEVKEDPEYDTFTIVYEQCKLDTESLGCYQTDWENLLINEIETNKALTKLILPPANSHAIIPQEELV